MTGLGQAVQSVIKRGRTSGSYLGNVTQIDEVGLSLSIDIGTGSPLTGVRWISPYSPTVGDFVAVLRIGAAWIVMGKLSKNLTGPGYIEQTAYITPSLWALGGSWVDFTPPDNARDWSTSPSTGLEPTPRCATTSRSRLNSHPLRPSLPQRSGSPASHRSSRGHLARPSLGRSSPDTRSPRSPHRGRHPSRSSLPHTATGAPERSLSARSRRGRCRRRGLLPWSPAH